MADVDVNDSAPPAKKSKENDGEESTVTEPGAGGDTKWQLTKDDVKGRLAHLRKCNDFCDCVLAVGQGDIIESFKAHKMVLSMSSPKFEEIIFGSKETDQIVISDMDPRIFNLMLDYMYMDRLDLKSAEDACIIFKAAVKYQMPHLCGVAAKFMTQDMTLDTVWPILNLVAETHEPVLKEECGKFIRKNPIAILQNENFAKVDQLVVLMLADLDCVDIQEKELMKAVDRWAEHRCQDMGVTADRDHKRAALGPEVMAKLRFLSLSQEEFVKNIAYTEEKSSSCLLSLEESYSVLMNLVSMGTFPMPLGFNCDRRARKLSKLRCIRRVHQASGIYSGYNQPQGSPYASYSSMDRVVALASPTQAAQLGGKNFCLEVKVDKPIVLYGIQVPALWFPVQQGLKPLPKNYDESFIVTVLDPSGTPLSHTILSGKVMYSSSVDINLKESVSLHKDVIYKIQVYTTNVYFLNKRLSSCEDCPPVKFYFKDTAKVGPLPGLLGSSCPVKQTDTDIGFITQVIYSLGV